MTNGLLQRTTALYDAKPKVVLDVDLARVGRLSDMDKPIIVGAGDVTHTVYVVDEDGRLVGVLIAEGSVVIGERPW